LVVSSDLGIDRVAARDVRVLVLTGYGLNCEHETAAGFRMVGASVSLMHAGDVLQREGNDLQDHHIVAFVGGFSFGDHISSGRVYANRLRFRLGDRLARFVDDGGLAIGICNGFQTLVKLGLLPAVERAPGSGLAPQQVSLVSNDRLGYYDGWVRLRADQRSPCVFTRGLAQQDLELPSRHGEGKLVFASDKLRARIETLHLVPLRYVDAAGTPTEAWPDNPNGSPGGAAALCDPSGRVFGVMPHPEAYLYPQNHPDWTADPSRDDSTHVGMGVRVLANGVRAVIGTTD
jgi:phosphoribosylformylglycinamidine synthase